MGNKIEEPKDVFQGRRTPQNAGSARLYYSLPRQRRGTVPARNKRVSKHPLALLSLKEALPVFLNNKIPT